MTRVDGGRVIVTSGAAAAAGAALLALAGARDPESALYAYLTAYAFALSLALGALALVMIAHVTGAGWFVVVRRVAEAIAGTLPLFLLLVLPLLLGMEELYVWARPAEALPHELVEELSKKKAWLDEGFFVARSFLYLLVWGGMALALWTWSVRGDADRAAREGPGPRHGHPKVLSAVGLPVYGFTVTFASFDWLMSLQPTWHSTVFGLYFFAGAVVGALALMVLVAWALQREGLLRGRVAASHYHAAGKLLLTFVLLWAYFAYSQAFIVWIADLPHEVEFFLARWEGSWATVLVILMAGHFALPFFALLSRKLKETPPLLAAVAGWLLLMHWIDLYWLVEPALAGRDAWPGWEQAAALLAVGGAVTCFGAWRLRGHAPVPAGDPRLDESSSYRSR